MASTVYGCVGCPGYLAVPLSSRCLWQPALPQSWAEAGAGCLLEPEAGRGGGVARGAGHPAPGSESPAWGLARACVQHSVRPGAPRWPPACAALAHGRAPRAAARQLAGQPVGPSTSQLLAGWLCLARPPARLPGLLAHVTLPRAAGGGCGTYERTVRFDPVQGSRPERNEMTDGRSDGRRDGSVICIQAFPRLRLSVCMPNLPMRYTYPLKYR